MKRESIAQAKASAAQAYETYAALVRMQEKLADEVPRALAEWHAARARATRLAAVNAPAARRAAELAHIKRQISEAASSLPAQRDQGQPDAKSLSLDEIVSQVAGA
jgi:hypothetical protein